MHFTGYFGFRGTQLIVLELHSCSIESKPGCWLNHNAARPSTCSRCSFASQRPREDQIIRECNVMTPAKKREVRFAQLVTRTKLSPAPPGEPWSVVGNVCFPGQPKPPTLPQHVEALQSPLTGLFWGKVHESYCSPCVVLALGMLVGGALQMRFEGKAANARIHGGLGGGWWMDRWLMVGEII